MTKYNDIIKAAIVEKKYIDPHELKTFKLKALWVLSVLDDNGIKGVSSKEIAKILENDVRIAATPFAINRALELRTGEISKSTKDRTLYYFIMEKGRLLILNHKDELVVLKDIDITCPNFNKITGNSNYDIILKQRWNEAIICTKTGTYMAATTLLGSILEGILLTMALRYPKDAMTSSVAPKADLHKWMLNDLIIVAHDIGWIRKDRKAFSESVRDFRNIIHPWVQFQSGINPDEHTVKMSIPVIRAAIDDIIEFINKNSPP